MVETLICANIDDRLLSARLHASLCSRSLSCAAKDAYKFYFSGAVIVNVALLRRVEIDDVSTDESVLAVDLI